MPTPIGERLRTAREERGLSYSDAAEQTYIRERYLRALETEEFDALGEDVYAKGFLRNYAKSLGLDPEPLLDAYRAQYEHPPPDEAALTGRVFQGAERPLPRSVRFTAAAAAIVFVFALLAAVDQMNGSAPADAPAATTPPAVEDDTLAEVDSDTVEEPTTDERAEEDADPGADEPAEETDRTPAPSPATEAQDGVEVELAVVGGESWMRVTVDGDVAFEGIKADGESVTYAGDEEVSLRIGNAGAVRLTVNGEDHGAPGGGGEVVERSYRADDHSSA